MTHLKLLSPAKLNLFLHINGRLDNGYHELQTLFHFLDYGDDIDIKITQAPQIQFHCNLPELETDDNLIIKAVNALLPYRSQLDTSGLHITLTKRLPMGGGVGGGSSNAATLLLALNKLWQLNLPQSKLEHIGNQLGADVPIFIRAETSIADGTGEQLVASPIAEKWYLVLTPDAHVNTAKLFSAPDLPRDTAKITFAEINYVGLTDCHKNDFQSLVYNQYPAVAKALDWLLEYAPARMTGTGACVFAAFDTQQQAQEIFQKLPDDLTGFVAKGLNLSPTPEQINRQIQ